MTCCDLSIDLKLPAQSIFGGYVEISSYLKKSKEKWLRPTEMNKCYQNCCDLLCKKNHSRDWEKLLEFEAEGKEFSKILRSLEQFTQTVKCQNNFW